MNPDLKNDSDGSRDEQTTSSQHDTHDSDSRKPFVAPELRHEADLVDDTATTAFS